MKLYSLFLALLLAGANTRAQKVVFDRNHFNIVNENGAVRLATENTHNNYLSTINNRLSDIKINIGSVVLVQNIILGSLTQVNQALRSGIAVTQIWQLSDEIINECSRMIEVASGEPYLLLFAEDVARQMKARGINMVTEVSDFVLKEGSNVLMDFEKRDFLLRKITLDLKVMSALCFSMSKSMYWAKLNGVLKTANPYRNFINQDKRLIDEIAWSSKLLKPD